MKIRKTMLPAMIVLISIVMTLQAGAVNIYSWYCKREKEHRPPRADSNMTFVSQYGGYYIDKRAGEDNKVVYLTFDAGYENGNVGKVLDTLKDRNVTGAFFILGNMITRAPDVVKRMTDEGHLVCNHTYTHKDLSSCSADAINNELKRLEDAYRELTGKELSGYFRPPEGKFSENLMKTVFDSGYKTIFWSLAYADWDNNKQPDVTKSLKLLLDNIHPGAVILLHPTSETNAKLLPSLIDNLKSQGYRFGTLDELTGTENTGV